MPREMALKKGLVDRDVLESHDPFLLLDLENPVDQQERITVWQTFHYVFYRIHRLLLSSGLYHLTNQRPRPPVTRLHRHYARPHPCPPQRQGSDAAPPPGVA